MSTLTWVVLSSVLMSVISLLGSAMLLFTTKTFGRMLPACVSFAAGSLLGGAFLHMIPAAFAADPSGAGPAIWILGGFTGFLALEKFLHAHSRHTSRVRPVTWLIALGDGLHNLVDGLAVASAFLVDSRVGIMSLVAIAAHEVPQELGDFAVLIHGGRSVRSALVVNLLSSLTFLAGGLLALVLERQIDVSSSLLAFASGNFLYVAASDLVPEMKENQGTAANFSNFAAFIAGVVLLLVLRLAFG